MNAIQQTVHIPEDRRLRLDLSFPTTFRRAWRKCRLFRCLHMQNPTGVLKAENEAVIIENDM
jgi:hypothetical protein